jgi:hypothetical protein
MNKLKATSAGLTLVLISVGTGCASRDRLVPEHFTQIRVHATTEAEVVSLIGEPDSKMHNHWVYQRPDRHLVVLVEFNEKGRVSRTQWVDAGAEIWEDTADRP